MYRLEKFYKDVDASYDLAQIVTFYYNYIEVLYFSAQVKVLTFAWSFAHIETSVILACLQSFSIVGHIFSEIPVG